MTNQHPLTDEICESFAPSYIKRVPYEYKSMRRAADWQLECDAEWWKIILNRMKILHPNSVDLLVEEFKKRSYRQRRNQTYSI